MDTAKQLSDACDEMTVELKGQSRSVGMHGDGARRKAARTSSAPLIMPYRSGVGRLADFRV